MTAAYWVNGVPTTAISAADRGFQYGDGLFETFAVKAGRVGLLDLHLQRLTEGCRRLGISLPPRETLMTELQGAAADMPRAVLKLIITRGSGGRGYRAPTDPQPLRVLSRHLWPDYPEQWSREGVALKLCDTRLGANPALAGMKHLNRLEQVLARAEWGESDPWQEGLMRDSEDAVIEGTMTNIFAAPDASSLLTPALGHAGVAGVMRAHLMARARQAGLVVEERRLDLDQLLAMRELFVCNSIIGVWPVTRVGEQPLAIGPLTRRAQAWAAEA